MKTTKLEVTGGGLCRSKLLAAIAVLAIAFAVFAAVPAVADDSDAVAVDSKTFLDDIDDGGYTVTGNIVVDLPAPAEGKSNALDILRNTKIDGTGTLTLNYEADAIQQSLLNVKDGVTLTITGGVKVILNMTAVYSISENKNAGLHTIGDSNGAAGGTILIEKGSSLTVSQAEDAHGVSVAIAKIVVDNASFILDDANGINAGTEFDVKNGSDISITADDRVAVFNIEGSVKDSEIKATVSETATDKDKAGEIRFAEDATVTNSTVSTNGSIGFNPSTGNVAITATGTTFGAKTIVVVTGAENSVTSINGGTIVAENIKNIEAWGNKNKNASTLTLGGTTLQGANGKTLTAASGTKITAADGGIIAEKKVDLSGSALTLTSDNKLIASAGSEVTLGSTVSNILVLPGAKVTGPTSVPTADGKIEVSTDAELAAALKANGVTEITATSSSSLQLTENSVIKANVTLQVAGLTIPDSMTLTNEGLFKTAGNGVSITGSGVFKNLGTIAIANFKNTDSNWMTLENLTGKFDVKAGSLEIDGDIQGGKIFIRTGELKLSGSVSEKLELITKGTENQYAQSGAATVVFDDLTVNSGGEIVLPAAHDTHTLTYKVNGDCYLYGSLVPAEGVKDLKIDVPKDQSLTAFTGAKLSGYITVTGEGKIDLSQAQNPQNIGEDISADKTYGQLEDVTIVDTLNIRNNATVTILGGFNVNEGVTLTIEGGSELIIDSAVASMIVDGKIVVEEGAKLTVKDAKDVKISGVLESEGVVDIKSTVTVKTDGKILANETETASFNVSKGLTIEAGAELEVRSVFSATEGISNKGLVILNGASIASEVKINMAADSAVVEVRNFISTSDAAKITVTDMGMELAKNVPEVGTKDANSVTLTAKNQYGFKGLIITESIVKKTVDGDPVYKNYMDVSGTLAYINETNAEVGSYDNFSATVDGPRLTAAGELTLGTYVKVTINGDMAVSGKITAVAEKSVIHVSTGADAGTLTVTGLVQTSEKIKEETGLNAAMYEQTVSGLTNYYYTNLKAAVESDATTINVYGTVKVDESFTVAAGKTIKVNNTGEVVVGSTEKRDVVLTFADGSTLKNGTVYVYGTLEFDNKKNDKSDRIVSDTAVVGEVESRYTNIYTALNEAESGDVVKITKNKPVELDANITIKDGVTLEVPNSKSIKVMDGVTVTVNGTLKSVDKVDVESEFAETASNKLDEETSAIVVNGTLMTMDEETTNYGYYQTAGAYYNIVNSVGDYYYITPLEAAAAVAADVEDGIIEVYGKVTAGDIKFTGTEDTSVAIVVVGDLTVSSITLENAVVITPTLSESDEYEISTITGTIIAEDAQVVANKANVTIGSLTDDKIGMIFEGTANKEIDENSKLNITSGKVYIGYAYGITVDAGATAIVSKDVGTSCYAHDMTVDGTLEIEAEATLNAGVLTINGTLTVSEGTDTKNAGTLTVRTLYVGVSEKDVNKYYTGADASVSGPVTVEYKAVVLNGSVLSESTTKSLKDMKSTAYDVEGSVWITVYANKNSNVLIGGISKAPVENAEFEYWVGEDKKTVGNAYVGDEKYETVYAKVNYEIYDVFVYANDGIANVYLNGDIMKKGSIDEGGKTIQGFMATVKAGDYTITFDLAQGWNGDVTMKVNGKDVSGTSFEASGDKAEGTGTEYMVQLSGVEKSDAPVTPVAPTGDDGMTITDYLLIILVVLIVVMAIIVAMRLMRS